MQTQRDHLQAYKFATGRLATALVTGDPGRGESPTRRGALGTFFGVILVVLLCAGFWVYGLISPVQKATWRQAGSIIVEKETGNRYLLIAGELRPVRNYASALLIAGREGAVRTVSGDALDGIPHGAPVGIPGAPDTLPAASEVLSGGWTRCLRPDLPHGQVLDFSPTRTMAVPATRQEVLTSSDGGRYLLWRGHLYPVPGTATLIALGLDGGRSLAAPDDWLTRLPTGSTLAAPDIPHAGAPAGQVAGHALRIGQLLRTVAAGDARTYVMLADGAARVGATAAALLSAQPGMRPPLTVDATALALLPVSRQPSPGADLPAVLNAPSLNSATAALCLRQTPSGDKLTDTPVLGLGAAATGARTVLVPPGHGVLVQNQDQLKAGNSTPQTYLITDQGTLYPLEDSQAATALRLSGPGTPMPSEVLALLPRGPGLASSAAAATVREG